jgi:hypothetical protein
MNEGSRLDRLRPDRFIVSCGVAPVRAGASAQRFAPASSHKAVDVPLRPVEIGSSWQRLEVRRWTDDAPPAPAPAPAIAPDAGGPIWQVLRVDDREHIVRLLQAFVRDDAEMGRLRGLLADEGEAPLLRRSDWQLVDAIAALIAQRRLTLWAWGAAAAPGGGGGGQPPAPRPPAPRPPPPKPPPPRPPPKPVGHLRVKVVDAKSNKPVANAQVKVTGPEPQEGVTPASGELFFGSITPGGYSGKARADGHVPGSGSATVAPDATATMTIPLQPGTVKLRLDGVAEGNKWSLGGLIVRKHDGNKAPRKKVTVLAPTPAAAEGKVVLHCSNAKVKFFDAKTGGAAVAIPATFDRGELPKDLFAEGVTHSDKMRDIEVWTDFGPFQKTDGIRLTVLWLDQPVVNLAGNISANNDKRAAYMGWTLTGSDALGLQRYNATFGARMGWGSEAHARVHPDGFNYPGNDLKLERDFDFRDYNGTALLDSGARSATMPPGNDTGPASARDDNPSPDDTLYDWDAAGLNVPNAPANTIHRTRNNFLAFGSITVEGVPVRCSLNRAYFIAFSQQQTAAPAGNTWQVLTPPDVAGDNNAGNGTTSLNWDLS